MAVVQSSAARLFADESSRTTYLPVDMINHLGMYFCFLVWKKHNKSDGNYMACLFLDCPVKFALYIVHFLLKFKPRPWFKPITYEIA